MGLENVGGRHLLWVDPARELVLASHWTEEPLDLIREVSRTVTALDEIETVV
ncbi:hypothetical protein AB0J84_08475 [Micromonospora arborensis]|uniref:hypothetical protein n=1 Tax=Micromonospora arborensis TaxID=2116518 RepID=UPI00142DCCA3|nr:hypothetical protein [Micromonospora arborensis]